MTQVATRHLNPLLKAVAPVKGVVDINADAATDDAPSFKDLLMKQVSTQAKQPDAALLVEPSTKSAKSAKQIDVKDATDLPASAAQALPDNLAIQIQPDASAKRDDVAARDQSGQDDDTAPVTDASKLAADINGMLLNPLAANMQTPLNKPELATGKSEKSTEATGGILNIAAPDGKSAPADKAIRMDGPIADSLKQAGDKPASKTGAQLANDPLEQSNGNLQKAPAESLDFAKTLSSSLAKSAEMKDIPAPAPALQPVASPMANLAMNTVQPNLNINTAFGAAGWDKEVNQKVVWMVGGADQSATLTLNPPDMGPVQVVINVNNDKADTTFISDNPEVRQALQDGMDNLREMMKQSGVELGQTNINSNQQQRQSQDNAEQARFALAARSAGTASSVGVSDVPQVSTARVSRALPGQVDTFA